MSQYVPELIRIITATEPGLRNQPLEGACASLSLEQVLVAFEGNQGA